MMRAKLAIALALLACDRTSSGGAAWQTVFDSTTDTVIARVTGDVSEANERRLVLEQRVGEAEGSDTVTFGQIGYIGVTADSRIFVLDFQGPTIKLLDSSGAFVRFVGRKGAGPGEFEQVTGMDVLPNGQLVLWDASHSRLNVYDTAGDFVAQWPLPISGFFTSNGLSTDRKGATVLRVPVTSSGVFGQSGFIRLDSNGVVRDTIRVPRWIDSTPQLIAATPDQQARASAPLPFAPKLTWTWSHAGALVSGPGDADVLHVTHSGDRPLRIHGRNDRVPVLPGEAEQARALVTWAMRRTVPDWTWNGPAIPGHKPAYKDLRSGYDGRIWVLLHSRAEEMPALEPSARGPAGDPPPPSIRYVEPNVYDVFEPRGDYLGRVRVNRGQEVLRMRGHQVWGILTDSLDVAYVARWRVEPPFPPSSGPR